MSMVTDAEQGAKVLGRIIGELESWQHVFRNVVTDQERTSINALKHELIEILNRLEDINEAHPDG